MYIHLYVYSGFEVGKNHEGKWRGVKMNWQHGGCKREGGGAGEEVKERVGERLVDERWS